MQTSTERGRLVVEAGKDTEDLVSFIADNLDDELLDTLEIERVNAHDPLLSEPITIGAIITLSSVAVYAVSRLLEKWLEEHREEHARKEICKIWFEDPKLAQELIRLEKDYSKVAVKQGMPDVRMIAQAWKAG